MSENVMATSYDKSKVGDDTVRTIWDLFLRRFKRHKPANISLAILVVLAAICYSSPLFIEEDDVHRIDVKMMRRNGRCWARYVVATYIWRNHLT